MGKLVLVIVRCRMSTCIERARSAADYFWMLFCQQDHIAPGMCSIHAADSHCSGCAGYNDSKASLQ